MHNAVRERWVVHGAEHLPLRGYGLYGLDLRDTGVHNAVRERWVVLGSERVHLHEYGLHGLNLSDTSVHNAMRKRWAVHGSERVHLHRHRLHGLDLSDAGVRPYGVSGAAGLHADVQRSRSLRIRSNQPDSDVACRRRVDLRSGWQLPDGGADDGGRLVGQRAPGPHGGLRARFLHRQV